MSWRASLCKMVGWLVFFLDMLLIRWLVGSFVYPLVGWFRVGWLVGIFFGYVCWSVGWLVRLFVVGRLIQGWLVGWLVIFFGYVCWSVGWLVRLFVRWSVDSRVGWLVGWYFFLICLLIRWLVGSFVVRWSVDSGLVVGLVGIFLGYVCWSVGWLVRLIVRWSVDSGLVGWLVGLVFFWDMFVDPLVGWFVWLSVGRLIQGWWLVVFFGICLLIRWLVGSFDCRWSVDSGLVGWLVFFWDMFVDPLVSWFVWLSVGRLIQGWLVGWYFFGICLLIRWWLLFVCLSVGQLSQGWLVGWLVGWMFHSLSIANRLDSWLLGLALFHSFVCWSVFQGWLFVGWLFHSLSIGGSLGWLVGWLVGKFAFVLLFVCWSVSWLICWLVCGSFVRWLVSMSTMAYSFYFWEYTENCLHLKIPSQWKQNIET